MVLLSTTKIETLWIIALVTPSINSQNSSVKKTKKASKYKGVHKTANGKWQPQIWLNGKNVGFGSYSTQEEAAIVYNKKAIEFFGPDACVNQISSTNHNE